MWSEVLETERVIILHLKYVFLLFIFLFQIIDIYLQLCLPSQNGVFFFLILNSYW